jgi:hypothetical protein
MATFSITTDKNMDELTGKGTTVSDVYNISGATLTIDNDTRVGRYQTATSSLSSITISSVYGGKVLIDATNVKWVEFSGGSGNIPVYNTIVSAGTGSGKLCGVWQSYINPLVSGATVPSDGYLKIKQCSGGTFSGQFSGITCTGVTATTGWICVVADESVTFTVPRMGQFIVSGDWFYLSAVTNGASGQTVQIPVDGGGVNTYYPGIWIETAQNSDQFEFWPGITGTTTWALAKIGRDTRSKYVQILTSGTCRIGSDGTSHIGYVPPANCRIRVPNVFLMTTLPASRTLNSIPSVTIANRPELATTTAGYISCDFHMGNWYWNLSQPYYVSMKNFAIADAMILSEVASKIILSGGGNGSICHLNAHPLAVTSCFAGGEFTNCKFGRSRAPAAGEYGVSLANTIGMGFSGCEFSNREPRSNAAGYPFFANQTINTTLYSCATVGGGLGFATAKNTRVIDLKYADHVCGTTLTIASYAANLSILSDDFFMCGVTYYDGIANIGPRSGFTYIANSSNVKTRCIGSPAAPLELGSVGPAYIGVHGGNSSNIEYKRIYVTGTRSRQALGVNSDKGVVYENVWSDVNDDIWDQMNCLNATVKGAKGGIAVQTRAFTSVYGSHFYDSFVSDTLGKIGILFNEPTAETLPYVTLTPAVLTGIVASFTSGGVLKLTNSGDTLVLTSPYYILGYTGFPSQNIGISGTNVTNHKFEYIIDSGAGFVNEYKTFNNENLSAETISPTTGFKCKLKITVTANTLANSANTLDAIYFSGATNLATEQAAQYPLDLVTYTLTTLKAGSEVRAYLGTDPSTATAIDGIESSTTEYTFYHDKGGQAGYIQIMALGYVPISLPLTYPSINTSVPVQQQVDRVYANP